MQLVCPTCLYFIYYHILFQHIDDLFILVSCEDRDPLFIYEFLLNFHLSREEGWYPINWFNLATCHKPDHGVQRLYVVFLCSVSWGER